MGRSLLALVFALAFVVSSLGQGRYVLAGPQWCEEDPVFIVNGGRVPTLARWVRPHQVFR